MLTILTTGSNGLLGQKLTSLFLKKEHIKLIATGQGENRYPVKYGYTYESLDISKHNEMAKILRKYKPDVVINAAAMTNVDACETLQDQCMELNVYAVENMAKICTEIDAHLIHISTDFIFDGTKEMYTETDAANPLSFYGKSKLLGEQNVIEFASSWAIIRTVLVYGVVDDMSRSNVVLWAYKMLKTKSNAKVVDDQFRTPTLAENLAYGCFLVAEKKAHGIYNIAGKDFMSIAELVKRIATYFHLSMDHVGIVKTSSLSQPAQRPPITGLDITKARTELGYEPSTFEEGLHLVKMQLGE